MAKQKSLAKGKLVTFSLNATDANEVLLAGDFNNWDYTNTRLQKGKDKLWRAELMLKPGRYEYKFVVDGNWISDPLNTKTSLNPFGTENSVMEI